jgi:TetR/AcrR family transcriptional repressor of mexJK operon
MTRRTGQLPGGRPPDRAKDAAILQAARASFFERGFSASTIEDIAARAGVSKVTIYKRFDDKDALFEAIVRGEMARMTGDFDRGHPVQGTLAQRLNAFGIVLLSFLFSPAHLALDRMLSHDLAQSPGLARRFFDAGPGHCRALVGAMLADAAKAGEIEIDDPLLAAADLFALWRGFLEKELQFGLIDAVDDGLITERVERGTRNFMKVVTPSS